jgi:very-short-patch-repair endonuclease
MSEIAEIDLANEKRVGSDSSGDLMGEDLLEVDDKTPFAFDSLNSVRNKLLSLTTANSLLHFRFSKTNCIRLIDELPDQIYNELLSEKVFTFKAVPEPKERELIEAGYFVEDPKSKVKRITERPIAEEWAKKLGFDVEYDLPAPEIAKKGLARHSDHDLQTALYPPELDARLRALKQGADQAMEEGGVTVLYIVLGFLEWTEPAAPKKPKLAPLFTLPVKLERSTTPDKSGAFRYTISLKDDALLTNITLREKLKADFSLGLPEINEESTPESYYKEISESILTQCPTWKIRRQAALVVLNFTKQVMYQDLDPANWPNDSFARHPIVASLFGGEAAQARNNSLGYLPEHAIDTLPNIHSDFPLIYDADSSQHSALIDAVEGKNLVIEGPPGTGKSQTITNLIAASISNGKRVLFVAEKMAALNVVKDRLDRAGLGDFCLEVHSHKTNKQRILQDLGQRINKQDTFRKPKAIASDIKLYEDLKEQLSEYVELINSTWYETGLTIHEIFNGAVRYRREASVDVASFDTARISTPTLTLVGRKQLADRAAMLLSMYCQMAEQAPGGKMSAHYWVGVRNIDLTESDTALFFSQLETWTKSIENIHLQIEASESRLQARFDRPLTIGAVEAFTSAISQLPALDGDENLERVSSVIPVAHRWPNVVDEYVSLSGELAAIACYISPDRVRGEDLHEVVSTLRSGAHELKMPFDTTLEQANKAYTELSTLIHETKLLDSKLGQLRQGIDPNLAAVLCVSHNGIKELEVAVRLIQELPHACWKYRNTAFDSVETDETIAEISAELARMTALHSQVSEKFDLNEVSSSGNLRAHERTLVNGGVFKWLSGEWRAARAAVLAFARPDAKKTALAGLGDLAQYVECAERLRAIGQRNPVLAPHLNGVETPIDALQTVRQWQKKVRSEYGTNFGDRVAVGNVLISAESQVAIALADFYSRELHSLVQSIKSKVASLAVTLPDLVAPEFNHSNLIETLSAAELTLNRSLKCLEVVCAKPTVSLNEVRNAFDARSRLLPRIDAWESDAEQAATLLLPRKIQANSIDGKLVEQARRLGEIALACAKSGDVNRLLGTKLTHERYESVVADSKKVCNCLNEQVSARNAFVSTGDVSLVQWLAGSGDDISRLILRNRKALDNRKWLYTWLDYQKASSRLRSDGLESMVKALEDGIFPPQKLPVVLQCVIFNRLATEILADQPELRDFSGMEQQAIRERFQEYDKRLMKLQREMIAHKTSNVEIPPGKSTGKVGEFTERGLIEHNLTLKKPRIAIRTLLDRSSEAIMRLKPCFMMSPMSVAQYLIPGKHNFDLVVMDEASQIRPEEALGSIARGRSLVVVGDPKQLPPTAFFQRAVDEESSEDSVALEGSESVLDAVIPMFNNRRLRWHYRSRHESLIAFSNRHFYDSNLVIFPSPHSESPELGIKYVRVKNGRFVERRNVEEAQAVVASAIENMIKRPKESIGLVAMNGEQRDRLQLELEQALKDSPQAQRAYEKNANLAEPIFIKNLENVQGDERDVILISMTYGPDQPGKSEMAQRFGPINSADGWRRLNVLFTRAKIRMNIFSSMDSGHIRTSPTSSRGLLALKQFLEYCETGRIVEVQHTGKAADSDFEISVATALAGHGFECEPQLGVAGYYLDLAVRDPGMPGRFLLGVECDGATYHSAASARDRDRLRQSVLEGLGWEIRRIWSTDWFKNPTAALQPIVNRLCELRTEPRQQGVQPDERTFSSRGRTSTTGASEAFEFATDEVKDLRTLLLQYNDKKIRPQFPKTDDEARLLRPAMLEALLKSRPMSKGEFLEVIPEYLRSGTASDEWQHLDHVLEIVSLYG